MCDEQNSHAVWTNRPAIKEYSLFWEWLYFIAMLTLAECHRASPVQYWQCTCWPCSGIHQINIYHACIVTIQAVCVCAGLYWIFDILLLLFNKRPQKDGQKGIFTKHDGSLSQQKAFTNYVIEWLTSHCLLIVKLTQQIWLLHLAGKPFVCACDSTCISHISRNKLTMAKTTPIQTALSNIWEVVKYLLAAHINMTQKI